MCEAMTRFYSRELIGRWSCQSFSRGWVTRGKMASLSVSEPQEMEGELCAIGGPEFRCFTVNSSENDGDIFFASLLCPNSGEFSFIFLHSACK